MSTISKRIISIVMILALIISPIDIGSLTSFALEVNPLIDLNGWNVVYPQNNQNDYVEDQQTGSGEVPQDIVGSDALPSTYSILSTDKLMLRVRINNVNSGDDNSNYSFKNFAFIGMDIDLDGGVDFFLGVYNPTGNNGRLGIYTSDEGSLNISPSTTGISGKPIMAFEPVRDENYSIIDTEEVAVNGAKDYFISFSFDMSDVQNAFSSKGYAFDENTPFRFMTGTAAQDNSFNQDLNGMDQSGWSSDLTWNELGVFSDVQSASGTTTFYTVSYDKNTGDTEASPNINVVEAGSSVTSLPSAPSKRGMFFTGWNTASDGSGDSFSMSTAVNSDMTVYAMWSYVEPQTITFDVNGGTWQDSSTTLITVITVDGKIGDNMPEDPIGNKSFIGWEDTNGTGEFVNSTTIFSTSTTLYAQWANGTNTAIFMNNQDVSGGTEVARIYSNGNSNNFNETAPSITRSGYTLLGWSTNKDSLVADFGVGASIPSSGTYYAIWAVASYTITFDGNNGTVAPENATGVVSGTVGVLPEEPTRDGYEFVEWNKQVDGLGEAIYSTTEIAFDLTVYAIWEEKSTVTFDSNNGEVAYIGSGVTSEVIETSEGVLKYYPQPAARENYSFEGWGVTSNATNVISISGDLSAYSTLYAVWSPIYTVTFDVNGGSYTGTLDTTRDIITSQGYVLYIPENMSRTNYEFASWNTSQDGTGSNFVLGTEVMAKITVYAQWNATVVLNTITYDGNGNTAGSAPADQEEAQSNANVTLSANTGSLEKEGFTFAGWNTAPDGSGTSYFAGETIANTGNLTLYAEWTDIPVYTITYDGNGNTVGSAPAEQVEAQADANVTLSANTGSLGKTGFTFEGWNTAADGSGTSYSAGEMIANTDDLTLYAEWSEIVVAEYTVTYNGNGHEAGTLPSAVSSTSGGSITVSATDIARSGYIFDKWNTLADGAGQDYAVGSSMLVLEDVTLYAKWIENPVPVYTITYDGNGHDSGNLPNAESSTSGASIIISNSDIVKTGYTFNGWNTKVDGSGTDYPASGTIIASEDVTLYAKWLEETFTISYDLQGGSLTENSPSKYTITSDDVILNNPVRDGYEFTGWSGTDIQGLAQEVIIVNGSYGNLNYTANWVEEEEELHDVKGTIVDDSPVPVVVPKATVKLVRGTTQYGEIAVTDSSGRFIIKNVEAGLYNLIISITDDSEDKTEIVEARVLDDRQLTDLGVIIFPLGNASSALKIEGEDTPPVVISNLHQEAELYYAEGAPELFVKVEMTVEQVTEETSEGDVLQGVIAVNQEAVNDGYEIGFYIDMEVDRYLRTDESNPWTHDSKVSETSGLIKVTIPLPDTLKGKGPYVIYRYHDSDVHIISSVVNKNGEYLNYDITNHDLILYVKMFSVYAVGFEVVNPIPYYTVKFDANGGDTKYNDILVRKNAYIVEPETPVKLGYEFVGWSFNNETLWDFDNQAVANSITLIAMWRNITLQHNAYMSGYPTKDFRPFGSMYRSEAASVFARLVINQMYLEPNYTGIYDDVLENTWYADAVEFVYNEGLMIGYGNGEFKPNQELTRQEFLWILEKFVVNNNHQYMHLRDIDEQEQAIEYAYEAILKGISTDRYLNGGLAMDTVERIEIVRVINTILNRTFDYSDANLYDMLDFIDLDGLDDVIGDIMEATIIHDLYYNEDEEIWIKE